MTEVTNRISKAKNWADEIDDLYHAATERRLRAVYFSRRGDRIADAEFADDRLPGARAAERDPPAGGPVQ